MHFTPPPPPTKNQHGLPMRSLTLFASFALLFSIAGLSASSEARQFELDRLQLDRLWGGVLGCAEQPDIFVTRDRFDGSDSLENIGGGSVPTEVSTDYSQCGRLALRSASSRILVDGIEDAIRQGGLAFDENFRLDSSIGYVWGENITGEADAVIPLDLEPLLGAYGDGIDHALFFQPGLVFWPGLEDDERVDGNIGLVYRHRVSPNMIAGGSLFYDYDFERQHERAGLGFDLQSGTLQAGLNYYHPVSDWTEGRTDYEEQALRGVDLRVGISWERAQFDTSMGWWRFEGEDEERTKWRPSFDIEAGYRIHPGVFLRGGYERHDSSDSLGSRWNAGLAFQFSLPGLDGAVTLADAGITPNLYEPVEREKRILYEERLGIPRVHLSALDANGRPVRGALTVMEPQSEDETVTVEVMAELGKPLDEDVMLNIVVAESSTADFGMGEDFLFGHKVYELDEDTDEQSAPASATPCGEELPAGVKPPITCQVMIPMGVTRFDIEATILPDMEDMERAEFIDFEIEVPDDYAQLVRAGGGARLAIGAHGNTIMIDTMESDGELSENTNGPTSSGMTPEPGMAEVTVAVDLTSPTPITLDVETSGTANVGTDYRISTRRLTIPANADSASLMLTGIDNDEAIGHKRIDLTFTGNLPAGWNFDGNPDMMRIAHSIDLLDDDRTISFRPPVSTVDEPDSNNATHTVGVSITEAPEANITVVISAGGTGETATAASDYTFTQQDITFAAGDESDGNLNQEVSVTILPDTVRELDETIILTIRDDDANSRIAEGSEFSLGGSHTITISASDNILEFSAGSSTISQEGGRQTVTVNINNPIPANTPASARRVNVGLGGSATGADYNITGTGYNSSTNVWTLPAGANSASLTVTAVGNGTSAFDRALVLTLTPAAGFHAGWRIGTQATHNINIEGGSPDTRMTGIGFAENAPKVLPRAQSYALPVKLDAPSGLGSSVTFDVAINGRDYFDADIDNPSADVTVPATLVFPTGSDEDSGTSGHQQTVNLVVTTVADGIPENDEVFTITLTPRSSTPLPVGLAQNLTHEFTIPAHDNLVTFATGSDAPATEIAEGEMATFKLNLSNPIPLPAVPVSGNQFQNQKFQINIASSTTDEANLSDISFDTPTGFEHLPFPPLVLVRGDTSDTASFTIMANEDVDARNETFTLTLSALDPPDGWSVPPETTHTFRIIDDEGSGMLPTMNTVGFEKARVVASEGETPRPNLVLKDSNGMRTSPPVAGAFRLFIKFDGSTPNSSGDIQFPALSTVDFRDGRAIVDGVRLAEKFRIIDDGTAETEEMYKVVVESDATNFPTGWAIEPGADVLEIVILPSDNTITFGELAAGSIAEGASTTVTATINEQIPAGETATIFVTPSDHYVLSTTGTDNGSVSGNIWTLPTGQSDAELTITAVDDTTINADKALTIGFGAHSLPSGWSAEDTVPNGANLTITDNDGAGDTTPRTISFKGMGGMSLSTLMITEPQTGYATITIDPVPTFDVTVPVTFSPAVAPGTPSDPAPYTPGFAPFSFYSGEENANGRQITTFNLVGSTITIPGSASATEHNERANADTKDDIEPITEGSVTLQLTANEDLNTTDENVSVTLGNGGLPSSYGIGSADGTTSTLTVTITDDDTGGTITLTQAAGAPPADGENLKEGDSSVLIAQATEGTTAIGGEGIGVIFEVTRGEADLLVTGLDVKDPGLPQFPQFPFPPGGGSFGSPGDVVYSFTQAKRHARILVTTRDNDRVGANQPVVVTMRAETGSWPIGWTSPASVTYTFNVDDNDARVGFVGDLPTTTQEGSGASAKFVVNPSFDDTKIPGPTNPYHIIEYGDDTVPVRLPFEVGLASGQSGTFTATVTGTDDSGSGISAGDVPDDVTINGQTDNTYGFTITGDGTVQTENIDLIFKPDGVSEGAETFTVKVTHSGLPQTGVSIGTLMHTITVRESGERISFINAETELVGVMANQKVDVPIRLGAAAPSGNLEVSASVTAGGTYISLAPSMITINNGAYAGNFVVDILSAAVGLSSDATATITLTAPAGWMLGAQSVHTIKILSK